MSSSSCTDHCKKATFSRWRFYRYTLTRIWGYNSRFVTFIGLNPSTADERDDDPTIRRFINFANAWGYDGLKVVNLFALRATDPRELRRTLNLGGNIVGEDNDGAIVGECQDCDCVVACWGAHGTICDRASDVHQLLMDRGVQMWCFGRTKEGQPKHPLYLPANTALQRL
ncbi:MAG: DUF1643 domain-containing protein [Planctomycetaceae bacterium]